MKRASLNHVYRLIWNERLRAWTVAAETTRARGKRTSRGRTLAAMLALGLGPAAHAADNLALPTNGQVLAGQGSIHQRGSTLNIDQGSQRLITQWDTFNIGKDANVVFNQPGADSAALNRVVGGSPSEILGSLRANGQVYLVNPSGIVFGSTAQVNVGALVASSLDIGNEDFLAGNLKFSGSDARGAIVNRGSIFAPGGVVALLAPQVTNEGTINADGGSALLAAGRGVSLDFVGDGLISYNIDAGTTRALVENGGLVQANGGLAVLTAKAADAVSQAVVNNTGTVRAQTLVEREGRILLLSDMAHGTTFNDGVLDASAPDAGNGGFVETSAANVKIGDNTVIDTRAAHGETGEWLLDPSDIVVASNGGTLSGATLTTQLNLTNVTLDTNSGSGGNGDIFINDNITVAGTLPTGAANSGRTLTLIANRDVVFNGSITSDPYSLNIETQAGRDVRFETGASVTTNNGNFTVGASSLTKDARTSGASFTMSGGSYVDVGTGSLDISVTNDISLNRNALRASGRATRYLNTGFTDYTASSYMRLKADVSISAPLGVINSNGHILGMTDVTLEAPAIGGASMPIIINRTAFGDSLTLNNTAGDTHVYVHSPTAQSGFSSIAANLDQQQNKTLSIGLGHDGGFGGQIYALTAYDGRLALLTDGINTAATGTSVSVSAKNIMFEDGSVDVGRASFSATAETLSSNSLTGTADVLGGTVTLRGTQIGSSSRPLEVAGGGVTGGADTLHLINDGGDTYVTSLDDSFRNVWFTNVKTAGTHSVQFASDRIFFQTNGASLIVPQLGIDVSSRNRLVSLTARSGAITFDNYSVNTGNGTLYATIAADNPEGASGWVIRGFSAKMMDSLPEIITGSAWFSVLRPGTGSIGFLEIDAGTGAGNNTLGLSVYSGDIGIIEKTAGHFGSIDLSLNGAYYSGQSVSLTLQGGDDVTLTDSVSGLILNDTNVSLSAYDRDWRLYAPSRKVRIDSTRPGGGDYSVHAGQLYLNGDVRTDGGDISLTAPGDNISLMRSVTIDSGVTGAAGDISITGNVSGAGYGHVLTVDSSSATTAGGAINFTGNLGPGGVGSYLGGAYFTSKGHQDDSDGALTLNGSSYGLSGTFSAIGKTRFAGGFSAVEISTWNGKAGEAGDILFGGWSLTGSPDTSYVFRADTAGGAWDSGDVDLVTLNPGVFDAKSVQVRAFAGPASNAGDIYLPAISTAGASYSGAVTNQTYLGNVITLHGDLSTNGGNIVLAGQTRLAESVTIRTARATPMGTSGFVELSDAVSALAPGKNLTIDTSNSLYTAGYVYLSANNAGGSTINNLSIDTSGPSGTARTIAPIAGISVAGDLTLTGKIDNTLHALTAGGTISLSSPFDTLLHGRITADSLLLRGSSFRFSNVLNQINTIAAQVSGVEFTNSGALTVGSVGGVDGVTSSSDVYLATTTGDLTLVRNVTSTSNAGGSLVLNAGVSRARGDATGGNIVLDNGATITVELTASAMLYTGSVDGSAGLTDLIGSGSGRFRYNSDEIVAGYTRGLDSTGLYAIYREQPTVSVQVNDVSATYGTGVPTVSTSIVAAKNGDVLSGLTYSIGDGDAGTVDGAVSTSGHYIVGTHSINANEPVASLVEELGYNVSGVSAGSLTVTPKELTVSITADRTYDGTTRATLATGNATVAGVVTGDVVSPDFGVAVGAFADKNVGAGKALTIGGVALSGADAGNYTVIAQGTGDITARTLNVDFNGVDRTYDGTTTANVIARDDRLEGDELVITQVATFTDPSPGLDKTIHISNIELSGRDAGNYVLASASATATANIDGDRASAPDPAPDPVPDVSAGGIPDAVAASVTSPQSTVNGTSDAAVGRGTFVGAGAGSSTLVRNASAVVVSDSRVALASEAFSLTSASGTTGFTVSQSGSTLTLHIANAPATAEATTTLPVFEVRGSEAQFSNALSIIDRGNSLSVTEAAGTTATSVRLVEPTGQVAAGRVATPNGTAVDVQVTIIPDATLLVTLPADALDVDIKHVVAMSLRLAAEQLQVPPRDLKALAIRRR